MKSNEIKGWLDPYYRCYFVPNTHVETAAKILGIPWSDKVSDKDLMAGTKIDAILLDKRWARILIKPDRGILYFEIKREKEQGSTWKTFLSGPQKQWIADVAMNGYEITKNSIIPGTVPRNSPLKIKFGWAGIDLTPAELTTEKLSFHSIMRQTLLERMSFKDLFSVSEPGRVQRGQNDVRTNSIRVATMDGLEAWTFNYKSNPSTTGNRWHGYVQFFKEDVSQKDNAEELDCIVDCDCPDYKYRFAYNNAHAGAGRIGRHPDWKNGNDNNGKKPRPRSQGGVGDYGVGLCKHLIALSEYLKTQITSDAPTPPIKPTLPITKPGVVPPVAPTPSKPTTLAPTPVVKKPEPIKPIVPVTKPVTPPIAPEEPTTTDAPEPDEDDYSDSRTGSLQESGNNRLYSLIDNLVKSKPVFDVFYDDITKEEIMEDYHHLHKEYRLHEGDTHITAIFEDNSKLSFEIHYHNNHGEDREKHRKKAFTTWKSIASKLHSDVPLSEAGNPIQKTWKECFKEALDDPKLQEYIRQSYHRRVFEKDDDVAPCMDPVNFTPR